jgi:hypothetical protein
MPLELDDCIALSEVHIYRGSLPKTIGLGGCARGKP